MAKKRESEVRPRKTAARKARAGTTRRAGRDPKMPGAGLSRKKLALIHIIKKKLGLKDDEYRCILRRIGHVESASELDEAKFRKVMYFFVHSHYYRASAFGITFRQRFFIDALVKQLGWDPNHVRNFVRKYYHRDKIDDLTGREASHLIEAFKAIQDHEARKGGAKGRARSSPPGQ